MNNSAQKIWIGLLGVLAFLIVATCICSAVWVTGGLFLIRQVTDRKIPSDASQALPMTEPPGETPIFPSKETPTIPTIAPGAGQGKNSSKPNLEASPYSSGPAGVDQQLSGANETLDTLESITVPANDLVELARRLGGITAASAPAQPLTRKIGDSEEFWVMNVDENRNFQIPARLVYITDKVYFWVEDGISFKKQALERLADTFDQKILPTNRQFFGQEWNPGIDGDPRLHILYARGLGKSIAGYFSSADEYPAQINEYSNTREMFVFNADTSRLDANFTYGVLAHEFQHMIHWYLDRNEETWINEGFADLASFLNGYSIGGADHIFMQNPDIQLNHWPAEPDPAHYGAAYLFLTYFLDRFGENATQALVADQANGLTSIDQVLAMFSSTDSITGAPIQADDVFIDWATANYLQDRRVSDGRYAYKIYPEAPAAEPTETLRECSNQVQNRQVHQYGADYIRIRCQGDYILRFEGGAEVALLPTQAHSGSYVFWSNRGDESDMTLTQSFDFSNVSGQLTLNYWTWYDIEAGYDHLYLLSSEDNGQSWQILTTPSGSLEDLSGNSFGLAYTGKSGDSAEPEWIQEEIDISNLAGKQTLLRFEYVTDSAANSDGFILDDISIPEIGYSNDFEVDQGGWEGHGFGRVQNVLPQTFRLGLIETGETTRVSMYQPVAGEALEIPIQINRSIKEVILVVAGTTRITRQAGDYRYQILGEPSR